MRSRTGPARSVPCRISSRKLCRPSDKSSCSPGSSPSSTAEKHPMRIRSRSSVAPGTASQGRTCGSALHPKKMRASLAGRAGFSAKEQPSCGIARRLRQHDRARLARDRSGCDPLIFRIAAQPFPCPASTIEPGHPRIHRGISAVRRSRGTRHGDPGTNRSRQMKRKIERDKSWARSLKAKRPENIKTSLPPSPEKGIPIW